MMYMTEEEAKKLDELLTETTPTFNSGKPGVFARQKEIMVPLDDFSGRYIMAKARATKKSPTELISEMVRNELIAAAQVAE
ncbi:hypothetical protein AGMMS49983_20730 [Clostridia bacterium]|nr:hypothetical protein AGMMS49983_20730 [Clostridia bacterium]